MPSGSGLPTPGAYAGSRTSMSVVKFGFREGSNSDLHYMTWIYPFCDSSHERCVRELLAEKLVPQVKMSVQIHDPEIGWKCVDGGLGYRMFPTCHDRNLTSGG